MADSNLLSVDNICSQWIIFAFSGILSSIMPANRYALENKFFQIFAEVFASQGAPLSQ